MLKKVPALQPLQPKNAEERAFWWGLVLPLTILVVSLKLWRVVERGEVAAWWAAPDLLRSDVMVVVAYAAGGWALLRAVGRKNLRLVALGILQVVAVVWAALEIIANHFFAVTGSTFDLHLLIFSLGRFDETFEIIASEVPVASWAFLGISLALVLALPWGLWLRQVRRRDTKEDDEKSEAERSLRAPALAIAVSALCFGFAFLPPLAEDYTAFGRANVVNMAMSVHDVRVTAGLEAAIDRRPLYDLRLVEKEQVEEGPRNLAIIVLESTRAQSMTVYDPQMETTPFLAELAEHSTVADRAYSTVPHTSKALVAMLCGLEPRLRMPITEAMPEGLPARCIAELLGEQGYRSVFLQTATERFEDRPGLVENMGYDDFIPLERMNQRGYEPANYFGPEDAIMLPYSREWLEEHGEEPFFATYLTLTPHHDYLAPEQRYGRHHFVDDDELNRYKNTLYYVDQFTRELMEQYQELGLYDDTLFVIMGDHGEAFGEHGRTQHDNVIWEEGLHVPLIIYDPTRPEAERVRYPVSQIDVAPTVFEWMGYDVEGTEYPGKPIWDSHQDRAVFSHCWYERRCMARIGYRLKYIDHFGQRGPEVYDLHDDPLETNNLADQKYEEIREWRAEVYGWRESVNALYREEHRDRVQDFILDEAPDGIVEQRFDLGNFARHLGYEIDTDELQPGQRVTVTHYFEVLDNIPGGWRLFTHGESGGQMLNLDRIPVDGLHPLDEWESGTVVADRHSFRVPREAGDTFTLYLGIYHAERGRVPIDGEHDGEDRAIVFEKGVR